VTQSFPAGVEPVREFDMPSVVAFITTRARGDFNVLGSQPSAQVVDRWLTLQDEIGVPRFAYAKQVHGNRVLLHNDGWSGWLRAGDGDGHIGIRSGTALAVTLADCVPVFLAHPSGVVALLHAGWRGAAGGIVDKAAEALLSHSYRINDCYAHLGPAICGKCYEVGPEVIRAVEGREVDGPTRLDLRAALGNHLQRLGVRDISSSEFCTRCHNEHFFSHRAGDTGRHIAVIARIA
jgi:YfiH family protein